MKYYFFKTAHRRHLCVSFSLMILPVTQTKYSPCDWIIVNNEIEQGCINPGRKVARATTFCTVAPNVCGPSILNLFHVIFWRLEF